MYNSTKCQECGRLFERTGSSLLYCPHCLEWLDAEAEELAREAELPPVDEFSAAYQDWERNR